MTISEISGKIFSAGLDVAHFARKHPAYSAENLREALVVELVRAKVRFEKQVSVLRLYREHPVGTDVVDLVVENVIAVRVFKMQAVPPEHLEHLQSYLCDSGLELGYILNFGATVFEFKKIVKPAQPTPSKAKPR